MTAPPLAPTGVFTYPGDTRIQDILLLPDGRHALALFRIGSVNLWSVLVYHWMEFAAAIAAGVLLAVFIRLLRRPRQPGRPHCRRCNYLLVGTAGDVCPECGASLTGGNRVTGRSRRPWFILVAVLFAVVAGSYAIGYQRPPYDGNASSWFQWLSPRLYDWAYHGNQRWLLRHKAWRCRVVEIDLADGAITREFFSRDGIMPGAFTLHPDGTSFYLSEGDRISQHDVGSGRRIASLRASDAGVTRLQQVTVDAQGATVYAATIDHTVLAWHPADGSHDAVRTGWRGLRSRVVLLPYSDRAILQGVTLGEPAGDVDSDTRRHWAIHDLETRQRVASLPLAGDPVQVSQEGRWIVYPEGDGFVAWDAVTGERRHTIPAPWAPADREVFVVGADERFVVVPKYRPSELRLWDLDRSAWHVSCRGPATFWFRARLSADRRRLVALGLNVAQTQFKILTWDLPP